MISLLYTDKVDELFDYINGKNGPENVISIQSSPFYDSDECYFSRTKDEYNGSISVEGFNLKTRTTVPDSKIQKARYLSLPLYRWLINMEGECVRFLDVRFDLLCDRVLNNYDIDNDKWSAMMKIQIIYFLEKYGTYYKDSDYISLRPSFDNNIFDMSKSKYHDLRFFHFLVIEDIMLVNYHKMYKLIGAPEEINLALLSSEDKVKLWLENVYLNKKLTEYKPKTFHIF